MSNLQIVYSGSGDFVLRVRCETCGTFVRADGLPIIMIYRTDTGRDAISRGVMAPVVHRSHLAICTGRVER